MRDLRSLLAAVVPGLVLGGVPALGAELVPETPPEPGVAQPRSEVLIAAELVREWDIAREAAWRADDPRALRALYVTGSTAGARDAAMLRSYHERGLRVDELTTQVFEIEVVTAREHSTRLRVVDRLARGVVRDVRGERVTLPAARPVQRTLVFRSVRGRWLLAEAAEAAEVTGSD